MSRSNWNFGITKHSHWLLWGMDYGFMLSFPMWTKRPIVHIWNKIACFIYGHELVGIDECKNEDGTEDCMHCCKGIRK